MQNLHENVTIIVNIVHPILPCKVYFNLYEIAFEYKNNCKYCKAKILTCKICHIFLSLIKLSDKKLPLNRKLLSGKMDHLRPKRRIKVTTDLFRNRNLHQINFDLHFRITSCQMCILCNDFCYVRYLTWNIHGNVGNEISSVGRKTSPGILPLQQL